MILFFNILCETLTFYIYNIKAEPEASEGEAGDGGDDTDKEADAASDAAPSQTYVHLSCVHCKEKCATFSVSNAKLLLLFFFSLNYITHNLYNCYEYQ